MTILPSNRQRGTATHWHLNADIQSCCWADNTNNAMSQSNEESTAVLTVEVLATALLNSYYLSNTCLQSSPATG